MYHQLHNDSLITIEDISYISTINNGYKIFYYEIFFKNGTKLEKELILDWEDGKIFESHNSFITDTLNKDDYRDCIFYRNFKNDYNQLVEKYKAYHGKASEVNDSCWTFYL